MTLKTLTAYFKHELSKLGYDDIANKNAFGWQLSYCQGDGIEFPHANICEADATILCDRIMAGKHKAAVKRALSKGVVVSAGGKYCAELCDYNCDPELTSFEMAACEVFISSIDDDLKSIERRLMDEGYKYLEATPSVDEPEVAIERSLGRLKLVVSKTNSDWFDLFGSNDEEDLEFDYRVMQGIINGGDKFFELKVELFDLCDEDSDLPLATTYLGNCILSKDEELMRNYGCEVRTQVALAVDEARILLGRRNAERDARKAAREEALRQEYLEKRAVAEREAEAERARVEALLIQEAEQIAAAHDFAMWSGLELSSLPASIGCSNI